ncbi:MAG: universal stress protein [Thermoproteota archaeon]|nr:universal stress protein [Thermoproteota archaeon]
MVKRILVPFDISHYSLDASNEAIELAKYYNANIAFIHIVEPEPYYDITYDSLEAEREVKDEITAKVNEWFSQFAEKCNSKNVNYSMEILFDRGSTVETIANYTKNIDADLIVIGHSTNHGFGRWMKGDVAKGVIDHIPPPCSVLVVKRN